MNKLKLVITENANKDLTLIADYIAKDNVNAAVKHLTLLLDSCRTLTQFPNIGTERSDFSHQNILFYVVKKRYIIVYKIQNENLYIIRILTTFQDICALL